MKKQLIIVFTFMAFSFVGMSQTVSPHAIGVRSGSSNFGFGGEFSYQHGMGDVNRLELDLGWRGGTHYINGGYSHLYLTGAYHWVFNIVEGFSWFIGPAAQVGLYSNKGNSSEDGITVGIGAQGGVEYNFNHLDVPIQVAVDSRPIFGFFGGTSGLGYGGAVSVRYTF